MKKIKFTVLMMLVFFNVEAAQVRFETKVGNIDIELYDDVTPVTVQNFLNYVNDGDYDNTVIHFSRVGRIIQGGGYKYSGNGNFQAIPIDPAIINEAQISNTEYTIGMARRLNDPNSAANQWFINLANNTDFDPNISEAGFTVFGKVIRGTNVVRIIESMQRVDFSGSSIGAAAAEFPVYGFVPNNQIVTVEQTITIVKAFELSEEFQVTPGSSGAYFTPATSGQGIYLEVLPSTSQVIMAWFTYDTVEPDDLTPSEIGYAGGRWLTAIGNFADNIFTGTVYESSGGIFDDGAPVSSTPVGSTTLTFNNCGEIIMSYNLYGSSLSATNTLQRISGANIAWCEQMANEANQGDN